MTPGTVAAMLLARAGDHRTGLRFEDRTWTWAEHVRHSTDRAAWLSALRRSGRPPHVGVLLDNVPEFSFLLGAAALSGAVVVGINPTRRGAELARDLATTDCDLVVTEPKYRRLLDGLALPFDSGSIYDAESRAYRDALAAHAGSPVVSGAPVDPGTLFMLIFTSGTSGTPKAVRCTHRKICGPGYALAERLGLSADDVCYLAMPLFHSNAMMAGWAPALAAGATMVLKRRFSASQFLPDVRRYRATYMNYVGKPLSYVLATPPQPDDDANTLRVAFGNEGADRDVVAFGARFGVHVVDGFGSTEGGVTVSRTPDTPPGSLGRPAPGTLIVDPATGTPCPAAVFDESGAVVNADEAVGEMVNTAGGGAFEGYYNDAAADDERMRGGWYWSGDLAYADAAGFYHFAGRSLDWLRVDGENIGTAPIERLLLRRPDVMIAAVYGVPASDVGDEVMAALVLAPGATFDADAFGAFLAGAPDLGTKWAPRYVRVAQSLPQTETNKVRKRVLAREAWHCADPVWWRPGRDLNYERLQHP